MSTEIKETQLKDYTFNSLNYFALSNIGNHYAPNAGVNLEDVHKPVENIDLVAPLLLENERSELSNDINCAICQDPLLTNHDVRTINHCEHMFHKQCIDTWFGRHIHCPCCRHDVREP
jgi:hypothetical protein